MNNMNERFNSIAEHIKIKYNDSSKKFNKYIKSKKTRIRDRYKKRTNKINLFYQYINGNLTKEFMENNDKIISKFMIYSRILNLIIIILLYGALISVVAHYILGFAISFGVMVSFGICFYFIRHEFVEWIHDLKEKPKRG